MSKYAIQVEDLGKRYRIGRSRARPRTLRETVTQAAASPFDYLRSVMTPPSEEETLWALRHISFDVKHGEVIGIIGRNGAGKSTLLKILSRITEPTEGHAKLSGRVGSLLEVGTGFHPELTGRENIYMNGAVLGMSKAEIDRKFAEIVEFSGVHRFIDTPVKRYSSGMTVRLAFSVAAHLEPEILIIDEVLAVGDVQFQEKCLGKMSEVAASGRTIAFVSHNITAVQNLCNSVIWLENGQIADMGNTQEISHKYLENFVQGNAVTHRTWEDRASAPGNDVVRLHGVSVKADSVQNSNLLTIATPLVIEMLFWNLKPAAMLDISVTLRNSEYVSVFSSVPTREPNWHKKPMPVGLYRSQFTIPANLLNDGRYHLEVRVNENQTQVIYRYEDALIFTVADDPEKRGGWYGKWVGVIRPDLEWKTERITD